MTYSKDFREKVLSTRRKEDLSIELVSKRFCIAKSTVQRWIIKIDAQKTRNKPSVKIDMEALKKDVEQYPDAYQRERAARFNMSGYGISKALKRLKMTYKKNTEASQS